MVCSPTLVLAHLSVEDALSRWYCLNNEDKDREISCLDSDLNSDSESSLCPDFDKYELWRVFYCREDGVQKDELETLRDFETIDKHKIEVRDLAAGAWRELNRNVPSQLRLTKNEDDRDEPPRFVVVARRRRPWRGPIAVLVGLKYGGNVGTIIRSAVQANIFQALYIVHERGTRTESSPLFTKTWGSVNGTGSNADKDKLLSDKDISYYSMWNAPLIEIRRFDTVCQFLKAVEAEHENSIIDGDKMSFARAMVCLDTGKDSLSLYSKKAVELFQSPAGRAMYLVIGAEDTGLPRKIVEHANALLEIPSMSASINVSCAFMACLSTFMLCNSGEFEN